MATIQEQMDQLHKVGRAPKREKGPLPFELPEGAALRSEQMIAQPVYAGFQHGTLYFPMWTGTIIKDDNGVYSADIVCLGLADNINGGISIRDYEARGYKHVDEVPDYFADKRDKFIQARDEALQSMREALQKQLELVRLGVLDRNKVKTQKSHMEALNWYESRKKARPTAVSPASHQASGGAVREIPRTDTGTAGKARN